MIPPITFFVEGKPQPAGSKRAFALKRGGHYTGRVAVSDANPNSKPWKQIVRAASAEHYKGAPLEGAVYFRATFHMLRPKHHYRTGKNSGILRDNAPSYPTVKPDALKLTRGVEDALTGVIWKDDAQVVDERIEKIYSTMQGVQIEVKEICEGSK